MHGKDGGMPNISKKILCKHDILGKYKKRTLGKHMILGKKGACGHLVRNEGLVAAVTLRLVYHNGHSPNICNFSRRGFFHCEKNSFPPNV
jgi:hypothetical protein